MRYTEIFLDMDNTLFDFNKSEKFALKKALNHFNIKMTDEIAYKYNIINAQMWEKLQSSNIMINELQTSRFELLFEQLNITNIDLIIVNNIYNIALGECTFLIDGAKELCKSLYGKCNLYIASNGIEENQLNKLKKSGLIKYIKRVFSSEKLSFKKPDKKFFQYMFTELNIQDKSKCIILGDSISADIIGGKNVGIKTCLFDKSHRHDGVADYSINKLIDFISIVQY